MGSLIDDLLAFARLGRKALVPAELDMRELARGTFERLSHPATGAKPVDLRLGSMPRARGDQSLFEQVWTNLVSNAIKFSSKKDQPVIEIGGISAERENVYFVRDNGAGFDAAYRERLFGVFQRLHHDHEFPGTGVGPRARAQDRDAPRRPDLGRGRARSRRDFPLYRPQGIRPRERLEIVRFCRLTRT